MWCKELLFPSHPHHLQWLISLSSSALFPPTIPTTNYTDVNYTDLQNTSPFSCTLARPNPSSTSITFSLLLLFSSSYSPPERKAFEERTKGKVSCLGRRRCVVYLVIDHRCCLLFSFVFLAWACLVLPSVIYVLVNVLISIWIPYEFEWNVLETMSMHFEDLTVDFFPCTHN